MELRKQQILQANLNIARKEEDNEANKQAVAVMLATNKRRNKETAIVLPIKKGKASKQVLVNGQIKK